jgi:hypothetical protein
MLEFVIQTEAVKYGLGTKLIYIIWVKFILQQNQTE